MSLRAAPAMASFLSLASCNSNRSFATFSRSACRTRSGLPLRTPRVSCVLTKKRAFHASAPSAAPKDPYQVLGVNKDATPAEIKKIYFSLARKFHPDTNPDKGARDKFVEIQAAYDILKDEKKRKTFDQYGAASQQPGFDPDAWGGSPFGSGAAGFGGGFRGFGGGGSPNDIFSELFGSFNGGGRSGFSQQNARGEDLEATIGVSFMEACKGTKRTVNVTPVEDCPTCTGSGMKAGAKKSTCGTCGGSGTRTFVIESGFQMASTCSSCQGTGTTIPRGSQCSPCRGVGKVRTRKSVEVNVPAGVEDGMSIRIPNAGDAPITGKGPAGDLLVRVTVASSKTFRRKGTNIYHEARIPLHTALLGGRVRVPTLDGDVDVRIPGGTQQGEEMILKERGVVRLLGGGDKGDLFVTFAVQLPRSLSARQREIIQQYADDVEGRTPKTNSTSKSTPQPEDVKEPYSSNGNRENSPTDNNNNDATHGNQDTRTDDGDGGEKQEKKRATA